jgi:hypothetical protein
MERAPRRPSDAAVEDENSCRPADVRCRLPEQGRWTLWLRWIHLSREAFPMPDRPEGPRPSRRAPRCGWRAAALLALAAPAALPAQAIGVGVGFGLGTRTGFSISAGAQLTDRVQLVCKAGGLPILVSSVSCGTHLYLLDDPDRFVVAEVGMLSPASHRYAASPREEVRWVFVQGGVGIKDHEIPDDDDDGRPEHPRWVNAAYAGGLALVVARIGQERAMTDEGMEYGRRRVSPALWPLFFADAQLEIYLPGRACGGCDGAEPQP